MSIEGFFVRPLTVLIPADTTDSRGDSAPSWSAPTRVATAGWLAQLEESEPQAAGRPNVTVVRDVLRLPADTPITAQARVEIDGTTYEVDGEPRRVWTPRGAHHLRVNLKAVAG